MLKVHLINDRIGQLTEFCEDAELVVDVQHNLLVVPVPTPYIHVDDDGNEVLASFIATSNKPNQESEIPYILVCVDVDDFYEIKESVVHELVHYEQWRDGRNITERGVTVRARNILKQINELGEK